MSNIFLVLWEGTLSNQVFCLFVLEWKEKKVYFQKPDTHDLVHPRESRVHFRERWNYVGREQVSALSCQGSIAVCGQTWLLKIVAKVKHLQLMS